MSTPPALLLTLWHRCRLKPAKWKKTSSSLTPWRCHASVRIMCAFADSIKFCNRSRSFTILRISVKTTGTSEATELNVANYLAICLRVWQAYKQLQACKTHREKKASWRVISTSFFVLSQTQAAATQAARAQAAFGFTNPQTWPLLPDATTRWCNFKKRSIC